MARLVQDEQLGRAARLEALTRKVYLENTPHKIMQLSQEDMDLSSDRLCRQSMMELAKKREEFAAMYVKPLVPKRVLEADQIACSVGRLYRALEGGSKDSGWRSEAEREQSRKLDEKYNPVRPKVLRSNKEWAGTIERLSQLPERYQK